MKNSTFVYCLITVIAFASSDYATAQQRTTQPAIAQSKSGQPRVAAVPKTPAAKLPRVNINVQLPDWRTVHSHNPAETQSMVDRLQKIGCEVVKRQHNGHEDILYRCIEWKSFSVNATEAKGWHDWLVSRGIDSVVVNPPSGAKMPTVRYRLPEPRSAHIHDADQLKMMTTTLRVLGCIVKTNPHNGHVDLNVSCPDWITIGVPSDQVAHQWQDWLNSNGFETQHSH